MGLINEFSIQLFSVKDETKKDFPGTLKRLAEMGYTGIEFAGYGDIPAEQMKEYLDAYNLKAVGAHVGIERMLEDIDAELAYLKVVGAKYITIPWVTLGSEADVMAFLAKYKTVEDKITASGLKAVYHNHEHEFKKDGGKCLLDIIMDNSNLLMQLDVYWAAFAGYDPVEYMLEHKDKCVMLHLKQISKDEPKRQVDFDKGALDFANMIKEAKSIGISDFIFEQEKYDVSEMESARIGCEHILSRS